MGLPKRGEFVDIWGLDPDLLGLIPRPVLSVLLLYPITKKSEEIPLGTVEETSDKVYFSKQTIGNACGTVGLLHAIANNAGHLRIPDDAYIAKFIEATRNLSPKEKAEYLEKDSAFSAAHEESALEGQTQAPDREDKINLHFVAFVQKEGKLYELDGRKDGPVCHGTAGEDDFLEKTVGVVKQFMARDSGELNFTMVALVCHD